MIRYFHPKMFNVRIVDSINYRIFVLVQNVLIIEGILTLIPVLMFPHIRKHRINSERLNLLLK
jgi:hypothetical protein